jgi:hypothetical protein
VRGDVRGRPKAIFAAIISSNVRTVKPHAEVVGMGEGAHSISSHLRNWSHVQLEHRHWAKE